MHAQDVTLEESLSLFEEANGLITLCHRRLGDAEKRVEVILKNRQGDVKTAPTGEPETAPL
jgi:exodeoxyribonuclease VII small subunit